MLDAAVKALAQMLSPPFRAVLLKSAGLALAVVVLVGIGLHRLLVWVAGAGEAWAEGILGLRLDPFDKNASQYPTALPERVASPALERALAERLPAGRVSSDPAQRMRHGHGHTQEDMWAVKHGRLARVPDLVVWPESADEVQLVLDLVRAHGACLVPCGGATNVTDALRRVSAFVRTERREVAALFAVVLGLVVLAIAASVLATAALGLIAFVPLFWVAALPVQLAAWIVRGVVFQYLGLTALAGYLALYRGSMGAAATTGAELDAVSHLTNRPMSQSA